MMDKKKLDRLKNLIYEINDINMSIVFLGWDQETYMPRGGREGRTEQIATLKKLAHEKFVTPEIGELLGELKREIKNFNDESDDVRLIKVLDRNYSKAAKVPVCLVTEMAEAYTNGQHLWNDAKNHSNFSIFRPALEKIVELKREYAKLFAPYDSIYDPLLDEFEPGLKTAEVKKIFNQIIPEQVNLLQKIREKGEVDNSFLYKNYDDEKQWIMMEHILSRMDYNWNNGRLNRSSHLSTVNFGINDVRMTTCVDRNYLPKLLFGTLRVAGCALYTQGISPNLERTPLAIGASASIYESQARLWENKIGRSLPFWKYYYPQLQITFSNNLSNVTLDDFYRGINKVKPSFNRSDADEVTYNLHVMVRFEIELDLMDGKIEVAELPSIWREKMKKYLGIVPPDDASGVLQDIHWATGSFGMFPTYTLGIIIASQLWEKIKKDIPDISTQIENAEFSSIHNWLKRNLHIYGAKLEPQELVMKTTGLKIDSTSYICQLKEKYEEIYFL